MDTELAAQLLATYREVARAGVAGDVTRASASLVAKESDAWCLRENYPDVPLEVIACEQIDWWACAYFLSSGPAAGEVTVEARTFRKVDGRWRLHGGHTRISSTKRTPLELVSQLQRHPRIDMPDPRTNGNPGGPPPLHSQVEQRPSWLTQVVNTYDFTPPGEWGGTILSTRTVLRPSGAPGLPEDEASLPGATELALVTGLAHEATARMAGLEVFASQASKFWEPFWVTHTRAHRVQSLSGLEVRAIFGGSLWSDAVIQSEPMDVGIGPVHDVLRRVRGRGRTQRATIPAPTLSHVCSWDGPKQAASQVSSGW
jgi:hypothetical protein